jgi:hypothetical protein
MYKCYTAVLAFCILLCLAFETYAQQIPITPAKKKELAAITASAQNVYSANYGKALALAKIHHWPLMRKIKNGGIVLLQGVNSLGYPLYLTTFDNIIAAATTQTNTVNPGGSLGLTLSGSSTFLNNKLAIFDGGDVYAAHQEFAGKTITLEDVQAYIDHATHVAGTMLAKGVYAPAKGMAFNAATLHSYYFDNDVTKMSAAASGLLLSNHSYGDVAGWQPDETTGGWDWYGLPGDTVDYNFGFYGSRTQQWDQIAYAAPYYLIVESSGNAHAYPGPAVGQDYYGYANDTTLNLTDLGPRPATISSNTGYETVSTTGNAKNILTVGAVNPLPNGPPNAGAVSVAYFSSWGPTNDGRIKPDIVGDGVNVTSCGSESPTTYIVLSGTSMSCPNVTGSLYLLQEYYAEKNGGTFMRAATLKGLACHTALDAGNAGPDYIYGWGLLNMKNAAQAITDNGTKSLIKENSLTQAVPQTFNVVASGDGALSATISWTDPASAATPDGTVESPTPKLVNDLDIRVSDGANIFYPWVLNPSSPSVAATTGDNVLDNIEQVYIAGAVPGKTYTITVSNKGTLQPGPQDYSLIVTGAGGTAYCASAPLSSADSKVTGFSLSNITYTAPAGCTTYTDNDSLTVRLEQGRTYPLTLKPGTCGANFNKAAKVYIDWNGDGIFQSNELVTTTGIITDTATFTTNITVPATVVPGNYSLLRVVLSETSDTATIAACGPYAKGETQDYRVQFLQTETDAGIAAINAPDSTGACPGLNQVTVTVANYGSQPISNIPVNITVSSSAGSNSFSQSYTGTLQPLEEEQFTLNGTFNAVADGVYTITAATSLANDPISSNNQKTAIITGDASPVAGSLAAYYCVNTKSYQLLGVGDGELLWYQNVTDTIPFAFGTPTNTTLAPVNNTYYAGLNDFSGTAGPATKYVFGGGGYDQFTPYVNLSTRIPIIIKSARLYIGNSGQLTFSVTNANGQIVSSATINAIATRTPAGAGAQPDDSIDTGAVYQLNLLLPAAGAYTISTTYDANVTLYRSDAGVTGYPFRIGDVFSIDGNDATSATDTAYYKSYYYYLYDIQLQSPGCASASKQAVMLIQPVITQNSAVLTSNYPAGNQWYLDGKAITGATAATYKPNQSGNYTVGATLSTGCQLLSANFVYVSTNGGAGNGDIGLVIYPVPASTQFNVIFASTASSTLNLSLIDITGRNVYSAEQQVSAGNVSTSVDVSTLPPGTYVFKLLLGEKAYYNKVVVLR